MMRNLFVALIASGAVALTFPTSSLAQTRGRVAAGRDSAGASGGGQARGGADGASGRRAPAPSSGGDSRATARPRDGSEKGRQPDGGIRAGNGAGEKSGSVDEPVPGRLRDDGNVQRTAVARRPGSTSGGGGRTVIVTGGGYRGGGFYPWGYGGLGLGGYYGGLYDPWWYGGDPYWTSDSGYGYEYEGSLRLKVKPRDASVLVDGYFAGRVDDFDGLFQSLHIESGPHRVEIRQDGFEPLAFEVRIEPNRKITYTGEMTKLP